MKPLLCFLTVLAANVGFGTPPPPGDTIEKVFQKVFPQAEKVSWYKSQFPYQVVFKNGTMDCRIWFREDGSIEKTIRYYFEEHLPPFIRMRLKELYPEKEIYGVTEITSGNTITFHIVMSDEKYWMHLQSDATANFRITNRYKKAKTTP